MKNVTKIIPCFAADTSGVCSALYELGGMTVVHDASGCNSTYSTHDEPRWYDMKSNIFISALTELDAILGNDEKLISDTVSAAKDREPKFIAICGSPMPMMTGVDYDAIAAEVEARTGIPTIPLHTNGTRSYLEGAAEAFEAVVKRFTEDQPKTEGLGINILGATPLDLTLGTDLELRHWLKVNGFETVCCLGMGSSLKDVKRMASAKANLVVSVSGLPAARYMEERFGIPYVCGIPMKGFEYLLYISLRKAAVGNDSDRYPFVRWDGDGAVMMFGNACPHGKPGREGFRDTGSALVIGEPIMALSIATCIGARVLSPLPTFGLPLMSWDAVLTGEEEIEQYIAKVKPSQIVGDPAYQLIAPGISFIETPYFSISGRCFENLMVTPLKFWMASQEALYPKYTSGGAVCEPRRLGPARRHRAIDMEVYKEYTLTDEEFVEFLMERKKQGVGRYQGSVEREIAGVFDISPRKVFDWDRPRMGPVQIPPYKYPDVSVFSGQSPLMDIKTYIPPEERTDLETQCMFSELRRLMGMYDPAYSEEEAEAEVKKLIEDFWSRKKR